MAYFPTENTPKMYQNTGFFTRRQNLVLVSVGIVALTALVVGVLALLHSYKIIDCGPLGSMPLPGIYALIGGGGALLLADLIALLILSIKHKQTKFTECVIYPENSPSFSYTHLGLDVYVRNIQADREIHQFPTEKAALEFTYRLDSGELDSGEYELYSVLAMKTEAKVHTHGKDRVEKFRLHEFIKKSIHECDAARSLFKKMPQDKKVYASHRMYETSDGGGELFSIFVVDQGNRQLHIFMDQTAAKAYASELTQTGFDLFP